MIAVISATCHGLTTNPTPIFIYQHQMSLAVESVRRLMLEMGWDDRILSPPALCDTFPTRTYAFPYHAIRYRVAFTMDDNVWREG